MPKIPSHLINLNINDAESLTANSISYDNSNTIKDVIDSLLSAPNGIGLVSVTGNGNSITKGDLIPETNDNTDFGLTLTNNNILRTFSIHNNTNGTVSNVTVNISGTEFIVSTPPASTLGPGDTSTFAITFTPAGIGNYTELVTISSDDPTGDFTFNIKAEETVLPNVYVSAGNSDFGTHATGESQINELTIINDGDFAVELDVSAFTSSDAKWTLISGTDDLLIGANSTKTVLINFNNTTYTQTNMTSILTFPYNILGQIQDGSFQYNVTATHLITPPVIYVYKTGDDNNDGSSVGNAILTINKLEEILTTADFGIGADVVVEFGPGTWQSGLFISGNSSSVHDFTQGSLTFNGQSTGTVSSSDLDPNGDTANTIANINPSKLQTIIEGYIYALFSTSDDTVNYSNLLFTDDGISSWNKFRNATNVSNVAICSDQTGFDIEDNKAGVNPTITNVISNKMVRIYNENSNAAFTVTNLHINNDDLLISALNGLVGIEGISGSTITSSSITNGKLTLNMDNTSISTASSTEDQLKLVNMNISSCNFEDSGIIIGTMYTTININDCDFTDCITGIGSADHGNTDQDSLRINMEDVRFYDTSDVTTRNIYIGGTGNGSSSQYTGGVLTENTGNVFNIGSTTGIEHIKVHAYRSLDASTVNLSDKIITASSGSVIDVQGPPTTGTYTPPYGIADASGALIF